jgi:26S proteasome regulatory subunit N5
MDFNMQVLDDDSFEDIKIKFNEYMIRYHDSKDNFLEIFRCYNGIYNTSIVKNDPDKALPILKAATSFLVLAPHGNEQHDFLHRIKSDANLEKMPSYLQLYKLMTTRELIVWSTIESDMKADLTSSGNAEGVPAEASAVDYQGAFCGDNGEKRWGVFKDRVTEYNIRVIGMYYDRMTIRRLTELLHLNQADTETVVSKLVSDGIVWARIDRPAGIIVFQKPASVDDVLTHWSGNIDSLLDKVEKCCHLIYKENIAYLKK